MKFLGDIFIYLDQLYNTWYDVGRVQVENMKCVVCFNIVYSRLECARYQNFSYNNLHMMSSLDNTV